MSKFGLRVNSQGKEYVLNEVSPCVLLRTGSITAEIGTKITYHLPELTNGRGTPYVCFTPSTRGAGTDNSGHVNSSWDGAKCLFTVWLTGSNWSSVGATWNFPRNIMVFGWFK